MDETRLTFVAPNVSDLHRSLRFYRDVVGIPIHEASHDSELQDPWYGGDHAAFSWTDGAFLHFALYPLREPERPLSTGVQIGFHITDFEGTYERIVKEGCPVVQVPREEPWGHTARFLDPDGNIVSITRGR